jgi:hypothetical protein
MVKTEASPAENDVIDRYITALGALTVWWASLENSLLQVVQRLTGSDDLTTECLLDSLERASSRAGIVKKLALRPSAPSEKWQDCIVDICDLIANDWGTERNRLVHDDWTFDEQSVSRMRFGRKIGKEQAKGRKTLLPLPPSMLTHWEIYDLTEKVMHASLHLLFLSMGYEVWQRTGKIPEVPEQAIWLSKNNLPTLFPRDAQA